MDCRKYFAIVLMVWLSISGASGNISMDPVVTITETSPGSMGYRIYGAITQSVSMTCFVENLLTNLQVRWRRTTFDASGNEVKTVLISTDMDTQDVNKWSIEKPTPYSWKLRIQNLQVSDEGNYTCYIQPTIDSTIEANRTVLATDAPEIIEAQTSTNMQVREGERVTLKCNATGRPVPTIMWRREGNAILPEGGVVKMSNTLDILSVDYTHRGRYFCEAVNEVGNALRDLILSVQFPPKITPNANTVGQKLGYSRTLACLVDSNPQPPSENMGWIKNQRTLVLDERMYTRTLEGAYGRITYELVIMDIRSEDLGQYTCRATNSMGSGTADITLYESDVVEMDKALLNSSPRLKNSHNLTGVVIILTTFYHYCR